MFSFDPQKYAYPSHRNVVYARRAMACTSVPLGAQIGLDVMKAGGNAVDAAVAMAAAMPLLEPTEPYETTGFFGNVIFVCGAVEAKEELLIYYGSADDSVCLARSSVKELLARMGY